MRKFKEERGAGSTVTIIILLIVVIILGVIFYLRSNNLIQVDKGIKLPEVQQEERTKQPKLDVKGAVENLEKNQIK